ncbi:MAG: OmpA family protein [Chlorobium sp.]
MPALVDIYFDFDKSQIRQDAVQPLKDLADWMKANPAKSVSVEAHADAKGTSKYNLALGQRRANAAKDYLVNLGVEPARLKSVSYGKEKPFVAGSSDDVLAQNRRIHFAVE